MRSNNSSNLIEQKGIDSGQGPQKGQYCVKSLIHRPKLWFHCEEGHCEELVDKQVCQNDGIALISPFPVIEAPLPGPKPTVISLLEEGEEPWILDVSRPEAVAGNVSPGEVVEEGEGWG
ncbi:hypothetical protein ASZ78_011865 [Callipepla squamata]|uniref:KRAB domain-containing protein n=1 Tax=Callipepla squamata TaxID=9009 RepID=A0A226MBF1_CALSU|nr:hypothetical protein ASZ78_011865 [Callipepla squamata]